MNTTVFPFHDGHLTSVTVADREAILGLKQSDGTPYRMKLSGVQALSIDGFRQGNIILHLWSVTAKRVGNDDVPTDSVEGAMEMLFPGPHPSAEAHYHERHQEFLAARLDEVARGDAVLVFMDPAYGADLLAFCSSVELGPAPAA